MPQSTLTKWTRPVRRQVKAVEPRSLKPYVVTIDSRVVRIRLRGTARDFTVTYDQLYHMGGMNFSAATRNIEGK